MHAYIYARFSTLEQAKGTSLKRQLEDCRALCDRHGWIRSADRELTDEGRSAYHGANRAEGSRLADFERDAAAGLLPPETVLVVERLDRISRQSADEVFRLVSRLTDSGVTVATVDGDHIYRRGSYDFASLIQLIVKAQVSHEESEKKSQRLSAAWAQKRARAQAGDKTALTRRCPEWMTVDEMSGEYQLREDRADVVRRIFTLATSGHGKHLIARTLNREGVPTWRGGNGWHPSYVQKILVSRATVGEMQPHKKVDGKRVPEGDPIRNYYPAVVGEAVFAQAQADRASRTAMRGRRGKRISNLFSGLAKCSACGGVMTFRNKGPIGEQYLVCDNALRGRSCQFTVHFNYPALEAGVIDQTLHLALSERHLSPSDEVRQVEGLLAEQQRRLTEFQTRRRRLVALLSRVEDEEVVHQLGEIASEVSAAKADVADTKRRLILARGALTPKENIARIRSLLNAMRGDDDYESAAARGTVQQALRALIRSITCDPQMLHVHVDIGSNAFVLDRQGSMQGLGEIGLTRLLHLREKGWVLKKHENHPALGGSRATPATPAANRETPEQ